MQRHYPPSERLSWEDKVSEFMNKITEPVQTFTKKEQSPEQKQKPFTGKSLSEALILTSTNPQYDDRLFIEFQVQCMKIPSSEHGENMLCTKIVLNVRNNFCIKHV